LYYFLVATTSGFIQVACSRVQPRKVTIEKKDEINEYTKKRKRQKEERVSDVLDLSLVSKRFGFWPHITHVIVLTFKEIKHLSDYRTVGL
jgi:hypothetical protein